MTIVGGAAFGVGKAARSPKEDEEEELDVAALMGERRDIEFCAVAWVRGLVLDEGDAGGAEIEPSDCLAVVA